ncbi:MAG: hypothetical protein A3H44_12480 [Gammaproteobacteria bacterium RIFCSPLOWO2_02_FULL_57_10]|nr:MAG: hypothetical protein A3H44_12480 [Gammaproteobacteria bacterium RIFCSPLOWO2_02_FULL_57_10]
MNKGEALRFAKEIGIWVHSKTNHGQVKNDRRTVMAISVFQHVLDVADGIVVLIEKNLPGVAWTLARPLSEGYTQGVWLQTCATDSQLDSYAKGVCPKHQTLVKDIGSDPETGGAFIKGMMEKNSKDFHNLTHGGIEHISRHITEAAIEPNYDDDEIVKLLKMRNQYYMLVSFFLLRAMGKDETVLELNDKWELWSDAL